MLGIAKLWQYYLLKIKNLIFHSYYKHVLIYMFICIYIFMRYNRDNNSFII